MTENTSVFGHELIICRICVASSMVEYRTFNPGDMSSNLMRHTPRSMSGRIADS